MPEQPSDTQYLPILSELRIALQEAFEAHEGRQAIPVAHKPRRRAIVGMLAIASLAAITILTSSLTSGHGADLAYALPVLHERATDARRIRTKAQELVLAGANFTDARAIHTPYGTGYVMPATHGQKLCLAIPDPVDGYGVGCTPTTQAAREGLHSTLVGPHRSEFVAVLPANAQRPVLRHSDGKMSVLAKRGDVATVVVRNQATVIIKAGAFSESVTIPGPISCSSITGPNDSQRGHFKRAKCREG